MDVLLKHATEGYKRGLMPPRGGCNDCSDIELENAILYMLNTSKIDDQPFLKYKDP